MTATLRYMGSKRSLAPRIATVIGRAHPKATIADAFAGTCAVGTALAPAHTVIANDIHFFAEVVARALLVCPGPVPCRSYARELLMHRYFDNRHCLLQSVHERVIAERAALDATLRGRGWRRYRAFVSRELRDSVPRPLAGIASISAYQADPQLTPYSLFSTLFASAYVGVEQAVDIDSLRFAIAGVPLEQRDFFMLALLQAVSHCAATPGHFAQYLVPRDEVNTAYIARIRRRSVVRRFLSALDAIRLPVCKTRELNVVHRREATDFLTSELNGAAGSGLVIYADPPYSREQYGRFYHVLETLVLYDYPEANGKGRYRAGRFFTDFSRRRGVAKAMREFVAAAAACDAPLYLSYPRNGLFHQAGGNLAKLLRVYYPKVSVVATQSLAHSTMGGASGAASINVMEEVYYAR